MRFNHLDDWLAWQETLNPAEIDLGLARVEEVLKRLGRSTSFPCPLVTVAGTNGKGSVVAMLESLAAAAGLRVGSYTSPHLFEYNERIKLNRQPVDDPVICEIFDSIDKARGEVPLTYFEFGTLAAIELFFRQPPDLVILEVGLGGRLDAVNIMDADVSVLTSVAIDHIDWLGDDRESIGFEKAGIFREGRPVICGDQKPPASVKAHAEKLHCRLLQIGIEYAVELDDEGGDKSGEPNHTQRHLWNLKSRFGEVTDLVEPNLVGEFQRANAATAIVAVQALIEEGLLASHSMESIFNREVINMALQDIQLYGRYQQVHQAPAVFVDVAHNVQAAQALSGQMQAQNRNLKQNGNGVTWGIVAMLADKDISGVLDSVAKQVDRWCFAGLTDIARGLSVEALFEGLAENNCIAGHELPDRLQDRLPVQLHDELRLNQCTMLSENIMLASTVDEACKQVLSKADTDDTIVVFGSFYTVSEAMQYFQH
jgi:dihydrofolate synthase/folylpolyglutamate synthase